MRQPWIACPKDPRTEGVKIPPVRGPCADFQYFMCIVLAPAGDFLSVAFLYKERVSDGLLFPIAGKVGNRPAPALSKGMLRLSPRADSETSLPTGLGMIDLSYNRTFSGPITFCLLVVWQSVPHGRTSGFFNRPSSGSVSRRKSIPCFGGAYDATLTHDRGSLETSGFKWRSLVTFCRYWQKVTRRRQQKRDGS